MLTETYTRKLFLKALFKIDKTIHLPFLPAVIAFSLLSCFCPSELHALACITFTATNSPTTTPAGTYFIPTPTITLTPTQTPTGLGQINVSGPTVMNPLTQPPGAAVTLAFTLTNNQWMPFDISSIRFQASGTGNDATGITGVDLYLLTGNYYISTYGPIMFVSTGLQHLGTATYGTDDGQIIFSGSPLLTVLDNDHPTLYLVYHFSNSGSLGTYQATIPNGGVQGTISCIDPNSLTDLNLPQTSQSITIANFSFPPTPTYTATPTATGNGPCYLINHTNPCQLFATQTAATTTTPAVTSIPPTHTPTPTNSVSDSPTETPTNSPTHTPTPTFTDTSIYTALPTSTGTATLTPTDSPTNSPSFTTTQTPIDTPTNTLSFTWTPGTPTWTNTPVMTFTITPTWTSTSIAGPKPVIFPNPATGKYVQIAMPSSMGTGTVRILIYTTGHRMVEALSFTDVQPGEVLTLSLVDKAGTRLANGFYFLAMTLPNGKKSIVKLIVLR